MRGYDLPLIAIGLLVLCLGVGSFLGAFWWFHAFVPPFYGLTLAEVLQEPAINIVLALLSIWVVPTLGAFGIAVIIGLVKAIFD